MRAITFGEIMLRLATPGHQRILQTTSFDVSYAGGEANVAVSLAAFGHEAAYVTVLPKNSLADAAVAWLRFYGVDTSTVIRSDEGRLGIYFLETGASQRASTVLYDRARSAIALAPAATYDWKKLLSGRDAFHTTGITPALGANCAAAARDALRTAKKLGLLTSFDLNYRAKLWSRRKARATVGPLLQHVDLVIGNEEDANDVLGVSAEKTNVAAGQIDRAAYASVARRIRDQYGPRMVAITLRESESASINHWSGCLLAGDEFFLSRRYTIHVVDRVGAGDAFCGGLISALLDKLPPADALEFAVAASCLKHSIPGDFNKVTKSEVLKLCRGEGSGRVVR
jgi:2-dehydro-3-deoxygluconokinase